MVDNFENSTKQYEDAIAWLEKQGEQKPADGQKFKVGDWVVVDGVTQQVTQILPEGFETNRPWNGKLTFKDVHLWTIQDAKEGDVLVDGNLPFLFKKIDANKYSYAYCGISGYNDFKIESDGKSGEWTWVQDIKPATKEQSDLLFQKMKEAGYEWDAEKKELKKIEQKPAEWSEEDEYCLDGAIETEMYMLDVVNGIKKFDVGNISIKEECTRELNWLKSLKDRVQPKQEWSEEDEAFYQRLEQIVCKVDIEAFQGDRDLHSWLKSLRPQSTWKPSDEQLNALHWCVMNVGSTEHQVLQELLEQLEKLKG